MTGRNVILYASKFLQGDVSSAHSVSIVDEDLSGFMEVIHGLEGGKGLDLIMHSPGGSVEAAEGLVLYIRSKFTDVRVIVPQLAQSAATMIACAANCVMMGKHSFLGPTDPQIQIQTSYGVQFVPAQAITAQFDKAVRECLDPKKLAAWMPMLGQYGPHLLTMCENFTTLSRELVGEWLYKYMYEGDPTKKSQSKSLSDWLSNHEEFKTHGRHISREQLESRGMKITHLEDDQQIQDAVLSIFHSTMHVFYASPVTKIIENQLGKAFVKQVASVVIDPGQANIRPQKPNEQQKPLPSNDSTKRLESAFDREVAKRKQRRGKK